MQLVNHAQSNIAVNVPQIVNNQQDFLIVKGENFVMEFSKATGYLCKYDVAGLEMIKTGEALTPNFWRAPTDNDYGANLQNKYAVWKNPEIKLTSLTSYVENQLVVVKAAYDMPSVSAQLNLSYTINNVGDIKVTQSLQADKGAEVAPMFRFGMQLVMPKSFDQIQYYGRGPVENSSYRKDSDFIGLYRQSVDD